VRTLPSNPRSLRFWLGLVLAFIPAAVVGLLLNKEIDKRLMFPVPVAGAMIVGGIILLLVDRGADSGKFTKAEDVPLPHAFFIGVFQCFALFPGTSRSAATIIGGRLLHLTRAAAAEYSFFLAIPTMFAAFAFKLFKARHELRADEAPVLLIGSVTSFIVAWIVVKWLIGYVQKHSLAVFGYYRIVLGAATLLYFCFVVARPGS
jgi:undecaprenyl-diphosphatase